MAQDFERIYSSIENYGIVPEIRTDGAEPAFVAQALYSAGLGVAGIIFETDKTQEAAKAAGKISAALPEMLLVAGNVASIDQAKAAADSGAVAAVVSAGCNEDVASFCAESGMPPIIGCGFDEIEALCARDAKFIVPAKADEKNIPEYLSHGSVIACSADFGLRGGSSHEGIKELAVRAVRQMLGFDLAHVVINCENSEQAERDSGRVEAIFGLEKTDSGATFSNADILHFTKQKSYGKNGQIAIRSNFIDRAVFYLKRAGRQFIEESARFDAEGRLASIYLDNIIGGFAIKLVRK